MNRRSFILSAGAALGVAMTGAKPRGQKDEVMPPKKLGFEGTHVQSTDLVGHGRLFAQDASVLSGTHRYNVDGISCIIQPESVIFLRDSQPIIAYRTTFQGGDAQKKSDKQTGRTFQVPFPCFTRLSSPTSLLPLSPLRMSAAAAFVCDNVNGVNYTAKNSQKNSYPCGQILSNGLKWKGMSEIGSDDVLNRHLSNNRGVQGVFDDECKWVSPDGKVQMTDSRRFRVEFYDKFRYGIYVTIDWHSVDDVQITANRNCLFGVQASAPLAPAGREAARADGRGYASEKAYFGATHVQSGTDPVGGMMMNSNGDYGASGIYGRRANWATCWGRLQAAVPGDNADLLEGVALMSHPSNPWGVSPWNVNRFGYMSPTHIPFLSKPWILRAGEGVRLRYLILAYTGNPVDGEVDEIYRSYSNA